MNVEFNGRSYDLEKDHKQHLLLDTLARAVEELRDYSVRLRKRIRALERKVESE